MTRLSASPAMLDELDRRMAGDEEIETFIARQRMPVPVPRFVIEEAEQPHAMPPVASPVRRPSPPQPRPAWQGLLPRQSAGLAYQTGWYAPPRRAHMHGKGTIYVAITRALSELVAAQDMIESGLEAYTPICTRWTRTTTGARFKVRQAILSRYVFVSSDNLTRDFHAIRNARRVTGVLGINGEPRALPPGAGDWIASLIMAEANGEFDYTGARKPKATIKQKVRIVGGQFQGFTGTLMAIGDKSLRVHVEGKHVHGDITLALDEIEAVDEKPARQSAA